MATRNRITSRRITGAPRSVPEHIIGKMVDSMQTGIAALRNAFGSDASARKVGPRTNPRFIFRLPWRRTGSHPGQGVREMTRRVGGIQWAAERDNNRVRRGLAPIHVGNFTGEARS